MPEGRRGDIPLSPQENSEAAKRELCARFDALAALLEEKKAELLQRISQEQADKTAFIQSLICQYKEQLEKSSRLVETAIQAAEETGGAAFLMVSPPNLPPPRCARWGPAVGGDLVAAVASLTSFSSLFSFSFPFSLSTERQAAHKNVSAQTGAISAIHGQGLAGGGCPDPLPWCPTRGQGHTCPCSPCPGSWRPPRVVAWTRSSRATRAWTPSP